MQSREPFGVFRILRLAGWLPALACVAAPVSSLTPGEESVVTPPSLPGVALHIYVPTRYQPQIRWPVVFFYPGQGETPGTGFIRRYAGERDHIVVGLPYAAEDKPSLTPQEYEAQTRKELAQLRAARAWLGTCLSVDETRVILAGVSKGGWTVAALADLEFPRLGGLAILLAGRRMGSPLAVAGSGLPGGGLQGKAVYIGTGEQDPNVVAAYRAREGYRRGGAVVTFEEYAGLAHEVAKEAPRLRAWFEVWGGFTNRAAELDRAAAQQRLARAEPDAAKRYALLCDLAEDPRLRAAGGAPLQAVQVELAALRAQPPVKAEWDAEQAFGDLVYREAALQTLANLRTILEGFRKLGAAYPQTHFGTLAAGYLPRVEEAYRKSEDATRRAQPASARPPPVAAPLAPAFPSSGPASTSRTYMVKEGNKIRFRPNPPAR